MINISFLNFNSIEKGTNLTSTLRRFFLSLKRNYSHYTNSNTFTMEKLVEDFFDNREGPGSIVTIEGFLCKYILTHRSHIHPISCQRTLNHKVDKDNLGGEIYISSEPTQFPIQAIPPIIQGDKPNFLYFLYPSDLSSFIIPWKDSDGKPIRENLSPETGLAVNRTLKPILVLSPKKITRELGKIIKITGAIKEADSEYLIPFYSNMSHVQQKILGNTLRPYEENISSLCLDLRESANIDVVGNKDSMPGMLYVESHFEEFKDIETYKDIVTDSLPSALPAVRWFEVKDEPVRWAITDTRVLMACKDYVNFAFSIEADTHNRAIFQDRLQELQAFTNQFRKSVQNHVRSKHGKEIKHEFDFIYDYSKANIFHPNGVLGSKRATEAINRDSTLKDDIDWLKQGPV